jgi:hypothetical protein
MRARSQRGCDFDTPRLSRLGALFSSYAGATPEENGIYQLGGCYVQERQVTCDVTYTLKKLDKLNIVFRQTTIFSTEGRSISPTSVNLGGSDFKDLNYTLPSSTVYRDIPIKLSINTGLPAATTTVRAIILESGNVRFDNITVRGGVAPVAIGTGAASAAAPTTSGRYDVALRDCAQGAQGTLTCTATLTPKR